VYNPHSRRGAFSRLLLVLLAGAFIATPGGYAQDDPEDEPPRIRPLPGTLRPGPGMPVPLPIKDGDQDDEDSDDEDKDDSSDESADRELPSSSRSTSARRSDGASGSTSAAVSAPGNDKDRQRPPTIEPATTVMMDFNETPLTDLVKFMAEITGRNFILGDDLKGEVTIISHRPVTVPEAYEAFLSSLEVSGYTTVTVGNTVKIVNAQDAANAPLRVNEGGNIPYTDNYVTQIFQLENVTVSDIMSVAKSMAGKRASIIAYAPTNTLIITDSGVNIRRMWTVVSKLDIAAPQSKMEVIPIINATATDIQALIESIYGSEETGSSSSSSSSSRSSSRSSSSSSSRRRRDREEESSGGAETNSVGGEGKYISKIIADDRTNSLIIMANETALAAIKDLVAELDIDIDPDKNARIHVVYLEHAQAEEVANVLANLSEESSSSSRTSSATRGSTRGGPDGRRPPDLLAGGSGSSDATNVVAALADGVKITSDENTNSLVIVASPESFQILNQVIKKLDIRRKQVFVEAVIMELASEDTLDMGIGYHFGKPSEDASGQLGVVSAQLNGSSLGLSQDVLSGMAMGVYGQSIDVDISDGAGGTIPFTIPAFGIALNAIQANSAINILSTPNVLTLDNEEAKVIVGRNIPFPVSTGRDSNNNPIVQYQREDVAITLQVTPQINESADSVTLEIFQEVTEIEEDSQGLDVTSAGFITSKRSAETVVQVPDNQTVVIGGLMGQTETKVETKIPILGDLPLIGFLFRGKRDISRKTNLIILLTPHVIEEAGDLEEVYRIKIAQRDEFLRRFYGKSIEEQQDAMNELLQYSLNVIDEPSVYRTKIHTAGNVSTIGDDVQEASDEAGDMKDDAEGSIKDATDGGRD